MGGMGGSQEARLRARSAFLEAFDSNRIALSQASVAGSYSSTAMYASLRRHHARVLLWSRSTARRVDESEANASSVFSNASLRFERIDDFNEASSAVFVPSIKSKARVKRETAS
jgi:hypothetical protein